MKQSILPGLIAAWFIGFSPAILDGAETGEKTFEAPHVTVAAEGISDAYGKAVAQTVAAARSIAVEQFGFDLPSTVVVSVKIDAQPRANLFNDGQDHIFLTVPSEDSLLRPKVSGLFNLYGFCHELGHMAMYRVIQKRAWLSSAGAEGWAHYVGSRLLDIVFAREGEKLWPDAYNYLEDGTARLRKQLTASNPDKTVQAAGLWLELGEVIGDKGLAALFSAWSRLSVDETRPAEDLGKALAGHGDKSKLETWWARAQPVLVETHAKSEFAKQSPGSSQKLGPPQELARDDGASTGKRSIAGSGHAVRFEAPGTNCFLTAVRLFGSRYGQPTPPNENAYVYLCDTDFKLISASPIAYATFVRGDPRWVNIPIKPTRVPQQFVVCVGFNPTATKGVFVHHDAASCGDSFTGLPGRTGQPFDKGDWLIRAVLQAAAN